MKKILLLTFITAFSLTNAQQENTTSTLAKSKNWTITTDGKAAVKITGPVAGVNGLVSVRSIRITNPRISQDLNEELAWNVVEASIAPSEKTALLLWSDSMIKYASYEVDYINLRNFRVQKLADSDLRNSRLLPSLICNEKYALGNGGNTVRIWNLEKETVLRLPPPDFKNMVTGDASNINVDPQCKTVSIEYSLYNNKDGFGIPGIIGKAIFSLSSGKLLDRTVKKLK